MTYTQRIKDWYDSLCPHTKVMVLILTVLLSVFILERIFFLYLYVNSIQEGLTVFLQTETDMLIAERNETIHTTFQTSVQNLPFCTASCTWELVNKANNTTVDQGNITALPGNVHNISTTIQTPSQRTVSPYKIRVSCRNKEARYCQSSDGQSLATKIVNTTYSEQQAQAKQDVISSQKYKTFSEQYQQNRFILNISDPRIKNIQQTANTTNSILDQRLSLFEQAVTRDNPVQAQETLNITISNTTKTYEETVQNEREAANILNNVTTNNTLYEELFRISDNKTRYTQQVQTLNQQIQTFQTANITTTLNQTQQLKKFFNTQNVSDLQNIQENISNTVNRQEKLLCTVTNTSCQNIPRTITSTCRYIDEYNQRETNKVTAYAKSIRPNQTLQQTKQELNISGFRQEQNYTAWNQDIQQKIYNNQTVSLNSTERLAFNFSLTSSIKNINNTYCERSLTVPTRPVQPTLQNIPNTTRVETPSFPSQQCCALGQCAQCQYKQKTPIIILHGHAITDTTTPEYSLQSILDIAQHLENSSVFHYGHTFPTRSYTEGEKRVLSQLPGNISFTATYYADTFEEEGQQSRLVTKSQTIETYSIRLSEIINSVLAQTQQDQVKIIAHSMGGLVTRSYLQNFGEENVERVILVATPNQGISGRTAWFCPWLGSENECRDMQQGSSFMTKIQSYQPTIPVETIIGVGCNNDDYDGVIFKEEAWLNNATNTVLNGTCEGPLSLHSKLIRPSHMKKSYNKIASFILQNDTIKQ